MKTAYHTNHWCRIPVYCGKNCLKSGCLPAFWQWMLIVDKLPLTDFLLGIYLQSLSKFLISVTQKCNTLYSCQSGDLFLLLEETSVLIIQCFQQEWVRRGTGLDTQVSSGTTHISGQNITNSITFQTCYGPKHIKAANEDARLWAEAGYQVTLHSFSFPNSVLPWPASML